MGLLADAQDNKQSQRRAGGRAGKRMQNEEYTELLTKFGDLVVCICGREEDLSYTYVVAALSKHGLTWFRSRGKGRDGFERRFLPFEGRLFVCVFVL